MSTKSTAQIDARREEFRKYLEKEGVLESLTKALVALYEEPDKPSDALSFVRNNFAASEMQAVKAQLENLTKENDQLKNKISTLENEKSKLEDRVQELEEQAKQAKTDSPSSPVKVSSEEATNLEATVEAPSEDFDPVDKKAQEPDNSSGAEAPAKSPEKSDDKLNDQTSNNDNSNRCGSPKIADEQNTENAQVNAEPKKSSDDNPDPKSVVAMETDAVQDE